MFIIAVIESKFYISERFTSIFKFMLKVCQRFVFGAILQPKIQNNLYILMVVDLPLGTVVTYQSDLLLDTPRIGILRYTNSWSCG